MTEAERRLAELRWRLADQRRYMQQNTAYTRNLARVNEQYIRQLEDDVAHRVADS